MNKEKLAYIEESGLVFEQLGMTRMCGRVFGYLAVCDEEAVSFDQIREVVDASKGSISSTTKQLVSVGFVNTVSLPGDRKTYYQITHMEMGNLLTSRMNLFVKFSNMLSRARQLKHKDDDVSDWLLEASTFYRWIEDEMEKIIQKWHNEKETILNHLQQNGGSDHENSKISKNKS